MLSSSAAADLAPFEGELRETFGEALADLPSRALQLARGASQAAGRTDAIERAVAVARLLLVQGGDPETIAAALISQAIPDAELDIDGIQAALGPELALLLKGLARAGRIDRRPARPQRPPTPPHRPRRARPDPERLAGRGPAPAAPPPPDPTPAGVRQVRGRPGRIGPPAFPTVPPAQRVWDRRGR